MNSIVVGTDGSPSAVAAVRKAVEIAKGSGALVHLVTAYPDIPAYSEPISSSAKRNPINLHEVAESVVARAAGEFASQDVDVETHAQEGEPAQVIIEVALEHDADLIVVGARGLTGVRRFLLGSVSSKLSHHAPCSVMIVREGQ
jgi:nucleotide-binding universal stress UspA family protein